jgi:hypothetical protein
MRTFTIELSDDAAGMLQDIQSAHGVKPEDVIRVCVEGSMADAQNEEGLIECDVEAARDPEAFAAERWKHAYELFAIWNAGSD